MNHDDITRYSLELDMLERDGALGDQRAIELLRSEFSLALNASYFMALSADDIHVGAIGRTVPQEGVARYRVALEFAERAPAITDEQAGELVRREFHRAQNASHFLRIAGEDFDARLVAREPVSSQSALRAA
jgi:hypothetical protein